MCIWSAGTGRLTKNCTLRKQVDYEAVGVELAGRLGKVAAELMSDAGKYAEAVGVQYPRSQHQIGSGQRRTSRVIG